ncbi:MAG: hypothetical protein VYB90_01125 [Actinomycetota bacterium]|nr:hypothetical protein [Actinomycetota bacterium]
MTTAAADANDLTRMTTAEAHANDLARTTSARDERPGTMLRAPTIATRDFSRRPRSTGELIGPRSG